MVAASRTAKTVASNPLVCAMREAWVAEGGPQAVASLLSWAGRVLSRVGRALSAVSPVRVVSEEIPAYVTFPAAPIPDVVPDVLPFTPVVAVVEAPPTVSYSVTTPAVTPQTYAKRPGGRYVPCHATWTGPQYTRTPHGKSWRYTPHAPDSSRSA